MASLQAQLTHYSSGMRGRGAVQCVECWGQPASLKASLAVPVSARAHTRAFPPHTPPLGH